MSKPSFFESFRKTQDYVKVPFKAPRFLILFSSFFILSGISLPWANSDVFQQLLLDNKSFEFGQPDPFADCTYIVNIAFSSVLLFGIVSGPFLKFAGSRICSITGVLLVTFSYVVLFYSFQMWLYYIAALSFGLAFQLLIATHVESAILFPGVSNLVVGFIASGTDISYFVTLLMGYLAQKMAIKYVVAFFLLVFCLPSLIFSFFLCPNVPFSEQLKRTKQEEITELGQKESKEIKSNSLENMSVIQQLKQIEFWLIIGFLTIGYIRKKHMITQQRFILKEIGDAEKVSDVLNWILPFGFLFSLMWSTLVDRFGVIYVTYILNGAAILYICFMFIKSVTLQYATIFFFLSVQAFVYNHMLSCLAVIFGLVNTSTLQGYVSTITGFILLIWDNIYQPLFEKVLGSSYRNVNIMLVFISALGFIVPYFLSWSAKKRIKIDNQEKKLNFEVTV